jgi:serine/threonine-protein kinase RsbW
VQHPELSSKPSRRIDINVESDTAQIAPVRRAVEQFAADVGFAEKAQAEVGLCVNEALANIVRYAYAGVEGKPIHIAAEWMETSGDGGDSGALRVTIRDWGNGVNPDDLPPKPRDPLKPGGVGLLCLHRLMDETSFTPQPDGMLLTMVKKRS